MASAATNPGGGAPEPGGGGKRGSARNLVLRFASSLAALALMYLALRWDLAHAEEGGWAWALLVCAMSLFCLREFYRLARADGLQPFSPVGYVLGPFWLLAWEWELSRGYAATGPSLAFPVLSGVIVLSALLLQLTRRNNENALANVAATVFGAIYCCLLLGFTLAIHHLELEPGGWPWHGTEFVVVCVFVSKVSDVGAMLVGSRWGRHKLIPRLSPGKTWEGAAGGLAFSVILLQFMTLTAPEMALARLGGGGLFILSLLLAAGGLAGDLAESSFKRSGRMKDAGAGVPGFGGALDLLDSLLAAAPLMYLFLLLCGARQAVF